MPIGVTELAAERAIGAAHTTVVNMFARVIVSHRPIGPAGGACAELRADRLCM